MFMRKIVKLNRKRKESIEIKAMSMKLRQKNGISQIGTEKI